VSLHCAHHAVTAHWTRTAAGARIAPPASQGARPSQGAAALGAR